MVADPRRCYAHPEVLEETQQDEALGNGGRDAPRLEVEALLTVDLADG
jgi:DNA topoisomerase IB